jgi:hypothetical protein
MGKKHICRYTLKRATIDIENIESKETKDALYKAMALYNEGKFEEADDVVPGTTFEFNAENMDSDFSEYLENPFISFEIDQSNDNYTVGIVVEDGLIKLDADIMFEIELKAGKKPEKFQEWLEDNGGWAACSILADWSYTDDQGGDFYIFGIKRVRR